MRECGNALATGTFQEIVGEKIARYNYLFNYHNLLQHYLLEMGGLEITVRSQLSPKIPRGN